MDSYYEVKETNTQDEPPYSERIGLDAMLTTGLPEARPPPSEESHQGISLSIILLTLCAIVPALMGALFYISIGFGAPDGVYYRNGTFARPNSQGAISGTDSFFSAHFSPLLVSSIASSVIGVISPFVMGLVAYHLAVFWLKASYSQSQALPTPFQYYHSLNLVTNVSPTSLFLVVAYAVRHFCLSFSRKADTRVPTSPMLKLAVAGVIFVLGMTWAIRILDIVLHEQIQSTILYVPNNNLTSFPGRAIIHPDCNGATVDHCAVINRTSTAMLGGLNQSTIFKVYEHNSSDDSRNRSIAYLGPADVASAGNTNYTSHTYAASSECEVYHPTCSLNDGIQVCTPHNNTETVIGQWNSFVWSRGFYTATWQTRLQTFLTLKGNLTASPIPLSNGANVNPFTTASFGCFPDYGSIPYNNTDYTFGTPFINWWTYDSAKSIPNKPYILCSISLCNTTVYDADYTLSNGSIALDTSSFTVANESAVIAVSSAGLFLGTPNTSYYQYGSRFLDDQIQMDLSTAGNTYGNSSSRFASAWAQAFSNRYLGWSAGAMVMDTVEARGSTAVLSISIPLRTTHAFAVLHFTYALGIIALGVSCLVLATGNRWGRGRAEKDRRFSPQDLRSAQLRLSDTSILVHELASRSGRGTYASGYKVGNGESGFDESDAEFVGGTFGVRRRARGPWSKSWLFGENVERDDTRVGLKRQNDGGLGFDFKKHF